MANRLIVFEFDFKPRNNYDSRIPAGAKNLVPLRPSIIFLANLVHKFFNMDGSQTMSQRQKWSLSTKKEDQTGSSSKAVA